MTVVADSTTPAGSLLDAYEPGRSTVFAGPGRTLLATGNRSAGDATCEQPELAARAAAYLEASAAGIVLAAIPFGPDRPAVVVTPETLRTAGGVVEAARPAKNGTSRAAAASSRSPALNGHADIRLASVGPRWQIERRPGRAAYVDAVAQAIGRIERGELDKIVLARSVELTGGGRTDSAAMLRRLAARDRHAYAYAIGLPPVDGEPRELVGASPELLVARRGRQVVSRPVAGSAERSADPEVDRARGQALLRSAKDLAEHAFVVDAVRETLAPYCRSVSAGPSPRLVSTATMWHLQTEVVAELADPAVSSLELALALHPTPAVCGTPTAEARAAITELEGFDRGFYAGAVGWCDRTGDGEWVVAIRCAEVRDDALRLYAGAGIVAGSEPESEALETSAKFRTMLQALGLDDIA